MNRRTFAEVEQQAIAHPRPIELYVFLDPLCKDCWSLQPILRRLQVEYERYFTLRIGLLTSLPKMNYKALPPCEEEGKSAFEKEHPAFPSIAIKAAEFQGKRAGFRFLTKLFEYSFLKSRNVKSFSVLVEIAEKLNLDKQEFISDFFSRNVLQSLQVDLHMAKEMEVIQSPTFVFFNENIEDEGLMVDGSYSYEIYEQILEELTGSPIIRDRAPSLEELFKRFEMLATSEIASIYGVPEKESERELKKLLLKQEVERVLINDNVLWRKR
ncbi:DsbA family protein [Sporosarcina aquimarina]|uniref:DsbA family protein n=1 Tax=Sporosarcina aquimarina TaxID=114975 RepID=A0ABU4G4W6_9BACL|nr:DsbA family protein [Sporosarcina aquimarina]MDW0111422.1 DsbA family protein [Sporosarcina aquimarina]